MFTEPNTEDIASTKDSSDHIFLGTGVTKKHFYTPVIFENPNLSPGRERKSRADAVDLGDL